MKKFLPTFILLVILSNVFIQSVSAQSRIPVSSFSTEVTASVGELYLSISGFISPYASVVLTMQDGTFLRASVADEKGNFYISQVLIKRGFSGFCLTAIDFKRLGESTTCIKFPPASANIIMNNIFLPPTLGLSRTEIAEGSTAIAFGYTMPNSIVTLKLSDGRFYTTVADSTGYYEFQIKNIKAGNYKLHATSQYKGQQSLSPTKQLALKALTLWEQFLAFLKDLFKKLLNLLTSLALGPLWLAIPIIILIIILILKLWPERFTFIYENKLAKVFERKIKERPLHHAWFVGY